MRLVVCGPPATGKTTVATRVTERLRGDGRTVTLLHSDDFSSRTYEQLAERAAAPEGDVVLDGTFYKREWQRRFFGHPDAIVVHLTAPLETCLERNRTREDAISERGVHVVSREFHTPDADLTVDTSRVDADEASERVLALVADRTRHR